MLVGPAPARQTVRHGASRLLLGAPEDRGLPSAVEQALERPGSGDRRGSARCLRAIRAEAEKGRLVYSINVKLHFGTAVWNIDLAMGPPAGPVTVPPDGIAFAPPSIQVAIEIKGVMTEHHKAVKNRKRDFEAHHQHVHNYSNAAIAGVVMVMNAAPRFQSPLISHVTVHKNPMALVAHCMNEMRAVTSRGGVEGRGIDAGSAIVVSHDNIDNASTHYVAAPPAPQIGDPLHYDAFIQKICSEYTRRFI